MQRRMLTLFTVAALLATACGGTDSNGSGDTGVFGNAQEPNESAETTPEATDAANATDNAGTADPSDGSGGSDGSFCAAVQAIEDTDLGEQEEETFGAEARQLFEDLQAAAPAEIADDVAVVIDTFDAVADLEVPADLGEGEEFEDAFELLLDPAFVKASENFTVFTEETCGIDFGAGDGNMALDELDGFDDLDDQFEELNKQLDELNEQLVQIDDESDVTD